MSEEPSPASSSGNSNSVGNSVSSPQSHNGPKLVICKQPPTHVFADEWFVIEVDLEVLRGSGGPVAPVETDCVAALLSSESEQVSSDPTALTVIPETVHLSTVKTPSNRNKKFRCKLSAEKSSLNETGSFVIRISPKNEGDENLRGLLPVTTRCITIVKLKLKVKDKEEWESVWYKDEGGRDKCMTATVGLYNKDEQLHTGEKVPLQVSLCYDNNDEPITVSRQDIFRTIGTTRHHIDKKSGTAMIRFRIEDVSKNHQGQEFRVEVAPDSKASAFKDIALTYTPNVSIRSKRNKRQRSATGKFDARGPSPIGGRPPFAGHGLSLYPGDDAIEASLSGSDVSRVREAMQGVLSWTAEVVNGLYPLQWHIIGYAQHPDGTPDYNRPYHNMTNPNAFISRVLSSYSESTRDNLRVLMKAVEKSGPGTRVESPFLPDRFGAMEGPPAAMLPPALDQRMPQAQVPYGAGAYHPVQAIEGFRDQSGQGVAMRQPQPMYPQTGMRSRQPGPSSLPVHTQESVLPTHLRQGKSTGLERESQRLQPIPVHETQRPYEEETREGEVEYVLAKQFSALRTGERLGFPAYSASRELLGFYRESSMKVGVGQFNPISMHRDYFGHNEILRATEILDEAIENKSEAVHALKDWGSISSLVDHALVYDWTKDMSEKSNSS